MHKGFEGCELGAGDLGEGVDRYSFKKQLLEERKSL